ncbi:MAG: hypothetical protein AAGJ37_06910 [Pseudomonadota bacterium]
MYLKKSIISTLLVSLYFLTGCLEVDDDSNDELTAALIAQNEILNAQLEQAREGYTVTITGTIVDAFDGETPVDGVVSVRTLTTVYAENVTSNNGQFSVAGLPANSILEIVISSPDESFLTRAFSLQTASANSGDVETSVGNLSVSSAKTFEIAILNAETNMPIEGLELTANSSNGLIGNRAEFMHQATFDEVNGVYVIVLPEFLSSDVTIANDADRDGERDWTIESGAQNSGTDIRVLYEDIENGNSILLSQPSEEETVTLQFRLSVINDAGDTITGATLEAENGQETVAASFDTVTGQYVLDVDYDDSVTINIGAITFNGEQFRSATLNIRDHNQDDNLLSVSSSGIASNSNYDVDLADVVHLSVELSTGTSSFSNTLEVVSSINPALRDDGAYSVFYSQPVQPVVEDITLISEDEFSVVRGNDSNDDIILPGNTLITIGKEIPVETAMSLNNTKLTITPKVTLVSNVDYKYEIEDVRVISTGDLFDLSDDRNFESKLLVGDVPFNINSLVADNDNYTNNGVTIVTENTAGNSSTSSDSSRSVYVFLPDEINQLRQFNLNKSTVIDSDVQETTNRRYEIVRNGEINVQYHRAISLAENENIMRESLSGYSYSENIGTSLADGRYYRLDVDEYMSDNTSSETNTITFDYAYETLAGDIETGTTTLPVQ